MILTSRRKLSVVCHIKEKSCGSTTQQTDCLLVSVGFLQFLYQYFQLFLAYCLEGLPSKPSYAFKSQTKSKHTIGQVVSYTCITGYEFGIDPVQTVTQAPTTTTTTTSSTSSTSSVTWTSYSGADFALMQNDGVESWQDAEDSCVGEGGHLASILSRDIQNQLQSLYASSVSSSVWIGLNDISSEGEFSWKNGDTFFHVDWVDAGNQNSDNNDCGVLDSTFKADVHSCDDASIKSYICMKGAISMSMKTDSFHNSLNCSLACH